MEQQIFQWMGENKVLLGFVALFIGAFINKDIRNKIFGFGFICSQWIRNSPFNKLEEKIEEDVVGALYRGLRSDNKKNSNNGGEDDIEKHKG